MAEVINLRMARKAKARSAAAREADANRAKFGQTKAEHLQQKQEAERGQKLLDGAKRDRD
ncbi:DUF4169 family protein [Novosphingobium sp.]|uniref:DUF4169 family protein n=1 Tax=Novosphingobium sp. TaxID=1874826 RepID=UPI0035B3176E